MSQVSFSSLITNLICIEIDALVDAFLTVNNSAYMTAEFNFDASSHPLLSRFDEIYEQLSHILTHPSPCEQFIAALQHSQSKPSYTPWANGDDESTSFFQSLGAAGRAIISN